LQLLAHFLPFLFALFAFATPFLLGRGFGGLLLENISLQVNAIFSADIKDAIAADINNEDRFIVHLIDS
jgi:hypothetical protein